MLNLKSQNKVNYLNSELCTTDMHIKHNWFLKIKNPTKSNSIYLNFQHGEFAKFKSDEKEETF